MIAALQKSPLRGGGCSLAVRVLHGVWDVPDVVLRREFSESSSEAGLSAVAASRVVSTGNLAIQDSVHGRAVARELSGA